MRSRTAVWISTVDWVHRSSGLPRKVGMSQNSCKELAAALKKIDLWVSINFELLDGGMAVSTKPNAVDPGHGYRSSLPCVLSVYIPPVCGSRWKTLAA